MADAFLQNRLRDLSDQSGRQGFITHTGFLSPAEQVEAAIWLKKNAARYIFVGGYEGAERQVCFLLPDYLSAEDFTDNQIADEIQALQIRTSAKSNFPSHRDYLGSLLGLGIRRDQIGDILVRDQSAVVLMLAGIARFVETQLASVGANRVQVSAVSLDSIEPPPKDITTLRVTAASMRLDKIAASGFGLSRTDMSEYIRSGAVQVDWLEELRPDRELKVGAIISLRGHGRIRLSADEGVSRKNRHILIIEVFN